MGDRTRRAAWLALAFLGSAAAAALLSFWTASEHPCRDLGPLDGYPNNSVSVVRCFPGFVVRQDDRVHVLLAIAPHLPQERLEWDQQTQMFVSRLHGETFSSSGRHFYGPANGDMWECPIEVSDRIKVDVPDDATDTMIVETCMAAR